MSIVIKRRATRVAEAKLIKTAQVKKARTTSEDDFNIAAKKFVEAAKGIRAVMKKLGSNKYEKFFGGFEECDALLQDPLYVKSQEAQYRYQLLLGADQWLKHEADKLGADFVSPKHFYKAWERFGADE